MWDETGLRCSLFYSLVNYLVVLYCIVVDNFLEFQNMGSCRVVARDKFSLSILAYWMAYALHCIWQCFTNKPFSLKIFPEAGCPVFSLEMISLRVLRPSACYECSSFDLVLAVFGLIWTVLWLVSFAPFHGLIFLEIIWDFAVQ